MLAPTDSWTLCVKSIPLSTSHSHDSAGGTAAAQHPRQICTMVPGDASDKCHCSKETGVHDLGSPRPPGVRSFTRLSYHPAAEWLALHHTLLLSLRHRGPRGQVFPFLSILPILSQLEGPACQGSLITPSKNLAETVPSWGWSWA